MIPERADPEDGFTLIELLIVVVILGVLAAVAVFTLSSVTGKSAAAACNSDARSVEIAVAAYNAQTGGTPVATAALLTAGPNSTLQSFPNSSAYTISIAGGVVMVATPASPTPVPYDRTNTCGSAGGGSTASTVANGVTATPADTPNDSAHLYGAQERLSLANTQPIAAMTVTMSIPITTGLSYNPANVEYYNYPGFNLTQSYTATGGVLTCTTVLNSGQTIPANFSQGVVAAQYGADSSNGVPPPVHLTSTDTWTITSTSNGIVSTISGTF